MSALRSAPEPLVDAEWLEWSSPAERGRARAWWAVIERPLQTLAGYLRKKKKEKKNETESKDKQ
jgi:hypothetical protein